MIKIKETSRDFDKVETYLMTIAPSIVSVKDVKDNTKIPVAGIMVFDDIKDDESTSEIMSIITPDKKVYSCQSKTFKRSVSDIHAIMGENPFTIIKTSGKTNAGRDYINCVLDVDSL